ncbi:nitrite reductase large subunit NirB [Brachybacterium sacelli]|uniref:assimilatory sulfite reductase (ferredoxin) n=1 Tax=Brachybacterium sacelli TaxID=173364 RepID=A0ABS4X6T1_9MICO|nr:nitrite reductase large subunit NirB [Brachybacterium sacelli]MBP2384041.1 nitrite reductase (NADH) large subunit [Brachybacterium sacelli]
MSARRIVVAGAGMVAHRFAESLLARAGSDLHLTVLGEEGRHPYDRVGLSRYFDGGDPEAMTLKRSVLEDPRVHFAPADAVAGIDRAGQQVHTRSGARIDYDHLVLATGSSATRPPLDGADLPGAFVYRTLEDVRRLRDQIERAPDGRPPRAYVIGGGLLGLEAAGALQKLGAEATVAQSGDRLMSAQLDLPAGQALRRLIEQRDLAVRTGTHTARLTAGEDGSVAGIEFADGTAEPADLVVFTIGVRPRDELARAADLPCAARGGVEIDASCRTADPAISAIGEVASFAGRCVGLVAPGYAMAEVVADGLLEGEATFSGYDLSTQLKLSGVEVASFGDAFATTEGALDVVYADPVAGVHKKLVLSDDAGTLLGGMLVGDTSAYGSLRPLIGRSLGTDPAAYLLPEGGIAASGGELPDEAIVCSCAGVSAGRIRQAVHEDGCEDAAGVTACTRAGATCGSCVGTLARTVDAELVGMGRAVSTGLCEHFDLSRRQLYDAVLVSELTTFSAIIERFGSGRGCNTCKPVLASILATLAPAHVLDGENATLQDTNDHVMANMQKDGTYSVVPRMPGGEVTPEGLIVVGEIARDFALYTKLTGGQRIDLFGARLEELPMIWQRLVDAGFESGQAYGKSLRTVKSCVGKAWCRYGVLDSTAMAVRLELRYRGLRAPHKLKLGVSGCARECAEARSKDAGIIATAQGWNLYVGGNGGATPRHAQLFAEGLDDEALVRTIDRFFLYYIRTADVLQRTAPWLAALDGGIDGLREVVLEDSLGLCADLDAAMERHVAGYEDEWAATLADPEKLRRFHSFVNAPATGDPSLAYTLERGQPRPASSEERRSGKVLIAGTRLEVRR